MKQISFYNRGQSLVGIVTVFAIVGLISSGLYYYLQKQTERPEITEISKKQSGEPSKTATSTRLTSYEKPAIITQKVYPEKKTIQKMIPPDDLLAKIGSLKFKLNTIIRFTEEGNTTSLITALGEYDTDFAEFKSLIEKVDMTRLNSSLLSSLRRSEWENYKLLTELKKRISSNDILSERVNKTKQLLDTYIKSQSGRALSKVVSPVKNQRKSSFDWFDFKSAALNLSKKLSIAITVKAAGLGVVHKKATRDRSDPKHGILCWDYERWTNLETGDVREESKIPFGGPCRTEIYIIDGATGRQLGLDPDHKLAEWVVPPKFGATDEGKKDPYNQFKNNLEKGIYTVEKTDILEGREVYLLKQVIWKVDDEERNYALIYLDALSYFPLKSVTYSRSTIHEITPDNPLGFKPVVNETIDFAMQFLVGEIIDRESLPPTLFELKIPEGYELKKWVPFG